MAIEEDEKSFGKWILGYHICNHDVTGENIESTWRIEGVMTCAAIDTVVYWYRPGGVTLTTWSCAGDEEPYLELTVTNSH